MGWFDEDDEEEEQQDGLHNRVPKMDFGDLGVDDLTVNASDGAVPVPVPVPVPSTESPSPHQQEDEEEDPLDAYMKEIQTEAFKKPQSSSTAPKSTRLDVENEEEATDHWNNKQSENEVAIEKGEEDASGIGSDTVSKAESQTSLEQMFHKASEPTHQHANVDIQLIKTHHQKYKAIRKKLLQSKSTNEGHEWRQEHEISCYPSLDPVYDFQELREVLPASLMDWLLRTHPRPTLVQSQTLPVALQGSDAIVTASTGSGKTIAYLIPILAHLIENQKSRALVLVPTRELALQVEKVSKEMMKAFQERSLEVLAVTGGNMGRYQLSQSLLKSKPDLIVATPGRLLDVLSAQQKSKSEWLLQTITFLALDEADKMLQLGFASQVTQILENLRPDRQSILTSATLHSRLESYCRKWMHPSPTRVSVGKSGVSTEHVEQHVMVLPDVEAKQSFLKEMLPTFSSLGRTIVFCATREGCEDLARVLIEADPSLGLQTLHGDKHPSDRQAALKAFEKGTVVKVLIATDVAGRGLDIPQVMTVINYDPAKNWDTHVHRIGRAGRLSGTGQGQQMGNAYTLLMPSNRDFANILIQAYQREGRMIPDDVQSLANCSNRNNSHYYAPKRQRQIGLGFQGSGEDSQNGEDSRKHSRWS